MSARNLSAKIVAGVSVVALAALATWLLLRAGNKDGTKKGEPPAQVARPVKETDLNIITLTPKAEDRLKLQTGLVERRAMPRTHTYGGEVMAIPGRALSVTAPLAGRLIAPEGGIPAVGKPLTRNQPVFMLLPLLSPDARINLAATSVEVAGIVNVAKTQVEATLIALDRAKRLLKNEAGSQRAVDEAQAAYDLAVKAEKAAEARSELLTRAISNIDAGTTKPLPLGSPVEGVLRAINARDGVLVAAGAIVFDVLDARRVWVRVPVQVSDADSLQPDAGAELTTLAGRPTRERRPMTLVKDAPPSANPLASSVDIYYAVDNPDGKLRPGERVGVTIPVRDKKKDRLVVPWSAIVYDIYGGTWVYQALGDHRFARRRVEVLDVVGDTAVLDRGLEKGIRVVTVGVPELFGTEFDFGK